MALKNFVDFSPPTVDAEWLNRVDAYINGIGDASVSFFAPEVQTASAGQTTFTLSSVVYTPGTNSLEVEMDGLSLLPTDFTEVSATRVDLVTPCLGGEKLLFRAGRQLSDSVTAAQVSTQITATGSVARNQADRNAEQVSVFDFMSLAQIADVRARTLTLDVTSAIQAAINAIPSGGGSLYFPAGAYRISSALTCSTSNVRFIGSGRSATQILQYTSNARIWDLPASHITIESMEITYAGAPLSGAQAIYTTGSFCHFRDFQISKAWDGIYIQGGVSNKITEFDIRSYENSGIQLVSMNDVFIDNFVMDALSAAGALGGIRMFNKAEAVVVSNGDIIRGAYSITSDATSNTLGVRPAYNKFSNLYFDSAVNGALIEKCVEFDFVSCWFSNRPNNGLLLANCDGIRFSGGGAINCAQHGVVVKSTAKRVTFNNFSARGNSTQTANTFSGILIEANTTDFSVQGCMVGTGTGFGTQKYGIEIQPGTSDRYIVADNLVDGNATGGVFDGGLGANKRVANNY